MCSRRIGRARLRCLLLSSVSSRTEGPLALGLRLPSHSPNPRLLSLSPYPASLDADPGDAARRKEEGSVGVGGDRTSSGRGVGVRRGWLPSSPRTTATTCCCSQLGCSPGSIFDLHCGGSRAAARHGRSNRSDLLIRATGYSASKHVSLWELIWFPLVAGMNLSFMINYVGFNQSLQALKKISHAGWRTNGSAIIPSSPQRVVLSTTANMCRKLPSDASDFVMEVVPLLVNLLKYHDAKVLEHASVCLTRIAEAFASSAKKLEELCNHGMVAQAAGLVSVSNSAGQAPLSTLTYTIYEIVNLADALLPPLPVGIISLPTSHVFMKCSSIRRPPSSKQASLLQ